MKKIKKLIKRLKIRSKKNSLSEKMSGDSVFCLKNKIVKIERNRSYINPKKDFDKMQGDHPPVSPNTGDHPFVDMQGDHSLVKPVNNKNNKE